MMLYVINCRPGMSKTKESPFSSIYLHSPPKIFIHNKINNIWQLLSKNWNCIRLFSNRVRVWIFVTKYMNLCQSLYISLVKYWAFVSYKCSVVQFCKLTYLLFDAPCKMRARLSIDHMSPKKINKVNFILWIRNHCLNTKVGNDSPFLRRICL